MLVFLIFVALSQFLIGMVLRKTMVWMLISQISSQFLIGMVLREKRNWRDFDRLVSIPHRYGTPTVNSSLSRLPVFILQ